MEGNHGIASKDVEEHSSPSRGLKGSSFSPEVVETPYGTEAVDGERTVEDVSEEKKGFFAYLKTRDFYIVLVLG